MNKKLICLVVTLTKKGFLAKHIEWDIVKINLTYVVTRIDVDGIPHKKHVKAKKINQIEEGYMLNSNKMVSYMSWCNPDKAENLELEIKKMCAEYVKNEHENLSELLFQCKNY